MTTFPGSPRVLKGALVGIDPATPIPSVIIFQYNPDTLTRTLQIQTPTETGDKSDATRLKGPPIETWKIEAELDAIAGDQATDEAAHKRADQADDDGRGPVDTSSRAAGTPGDQLRRGARQHPDEDESDDQHEVSLRWRRRS